MIPRARSSEPRNPFTLPVKIGRKEAASRHRLSRLTKPELIEQLLEIQEAYAIVRAAWLEVHGRAMISSGSKSAQRKHIHSGLV